MRSADDAKNMTTGKAASKATPLTSAAPEDGARSPAPDARSQRRRSGRGVAYLALIVALLAGSAAGYHSWRAWALDARVAALANEGEMLAAQNERLRRALERARQRQERQEAALEDARGALAETAAAVRRQQSPRPMAWRVAELEHLLRGANHRLLLERDVRGARRLLESADAVLAELDDFALHEVRALIAEDLAVLQSYRGADVQGVFLRLDALRGILRDLPLRLPEYAPANRTPSPPPAAAATNEHTEPSLFGAALSKLKGLVRFRRHTGATLRPLLPPEQGEYLEQHLLLAVERAQLAALRRHQEVFDASLATADEWLAAYLDGEHDTVRQLRAEFNQLRQVDLVGAPLDLSRPLVRLRQIRRGTSAPVSPPATSTAAAAVATVAESADSPPEPTRP